MASYSKRLVSHLASYKLERLAVEERGIYRHGGREIHYAHILPKALLWLNILEPYRSEIRQHARGIKLHKYFHHLNSSQAFALNLFIPFFEVHPTDSPALIDALGMTGKVVRWAPEHVLDKEEGTNVDIAWLDQAKAWTYCEVKLSEQEFGQAAGEPRHPTKLACTYAPVLKDHCPPELFVPAAFSSSYQIMRNVWLAAQDPKSKVIFLMPRENSALWDPLHKVRECLSADLQSRIHAVSIEDVLRNLVSNESLRPELRVYASQLAEKYVLPAV